MSLIGICKKKRLFQKKRDSAVKRRRTLSRRPSKEAPGDSASDEMMTGVVAGSPAELQPPKSVQFLAEHPVHVEFVKWSQSWTSALVQVECRTFHLSRLLQRNLPNRDHDYHLEKVKISQTVRKSSHEFSHIWNFFNW